MALGDTTIKHIRQKIENPKFDKDQTDWNNQFGKLADPLVKCGGNDTFDQQHIENEQADHNCADNQDVQASGVWSIGFALYHDGWADLFKVRWLSFRKFLRTIIVNEIL